MRYPLTQSLFLFLAAYGVCHAQSTTYSFADLSFNGPALAINDRGQVLLANFRFAENSIYSQDSATYQPVSLGNNATAFGFNSLDQFVGCDLNGFSNGNLAATYQNGVSGTPSQFYFEPYTFSQPSAINDAGAIVGTIPSGTGVQGILIRTARVPRLCTQAPAAPIRWESTIQEQWWATI